MLWRGPSALVFLFWLLDESSRQGPCFGIAGTLVGGGQDGYVCEERETKERSKKETIASRGSAVPDCGSKRRWWSLGGNDDLFLDSF
ncbi:hypothetical protein BKA56DRAFT_359594 [Ilyonectria sp. MPI-CAGE-AT-0026]|nr:hypothetical protein BKA56DRAFT_359594 [Ilyonectria sp. MPI-CAGE-AT-0026]